LAAYIVSVIKETKKRDKKTETAEAEPVDEKQEQEV
jgi:hypothetical protein